jgi:hypothetical protein
LTSSAARSPRFSRYSGPLIDDALFAILTASPAPVIAVLKWYANAAAQGAPRPYGVYNRYANPTIQTQDQQQVTRQWRYEITIVDDQYLRGARSMALLSEVLVAYSNSPAPGIMRFVSLGGSSRFDETQRYHLFMASFDIIENLP